MFFTLAEQMPLDIDLLFSMLPFLLFFKSKLTLLLLLTVGDEGEERRKRKEAKLINIFKRQT